MSHDTTADALHLWSHLFGEQQHLLALFSGLHTEGKPLGMPHTNYYAPAALDQALAWAEQQDHLNREVYFCAHQLLGAERKREQAAPVSALWADVDDDVLVSSPIRPTAVVESSPGRLHAYVRLDRAIAPLVAEDLNKRWAQSFGADPSGYDLTQVLRVPGTHNHKYRGAPPVRLLYVEERSYDPDELDRLLPPLPRAPARAGIHGNRNGNEIETIPQGQRNVRLTAAAGAMRRQGATEDAILAALMIMNKMQCVPPLEYEELAAIAASVSRYTPAPDTTESIGDAQRRRDAENGTVSFPRSAPSRGHGNEKKPDLVYWTAKAMMARVDEAVSWVCHGIAGRGLMTEVDGHAKLSGKTTFVFAMMRALLEGDEFIGLKTEKTKIVYLSEEGPRSLQAAIDRAGLGEVEDLEFLTFSDAWGASWEDVIESAAQHAQEIGASMLVVDTLSQWAQLKGDEENSAGAAMETMNPLSKIAHDRNIAVLVIRHDRKSGGDTGLSARGSSAFVGKADIVIRLQKMVGNDNENQRLLTGVGRFSDDTPNGIVIELSTSRPTWYSLKGDEETISAIHEEMQVLAVLPILEANALGISDIRDRATLRYARVRTVLERMVKDGRVLTTAKGKKFYQRTLLQGD